LRLKINPAKNFPFCIRYYNINKQLNSTIYFDYIKEKLNILAIRINLRGRLNILKLHHHSDNFYAYFVKELFAWKVKNRIPFKQNIEAIDLIDDTKNYIIQVSATNTRQKLLLTAIFDKILPFFI
jgi:hypothetical protein